MPFLDTPDSIIAVLTEGGRHALARVLLGELSFIYDSFAVGRGGYDMLNPVKITTIDPALTELEDHIFPVGATKSLESPIFNPNPQATSCICRLTTAEALAGLGEAGLWCRIDKSNIPAEVGTLFMFAVAHFPIQVKTDRHVYVMRFVTQF